MSLAREWDLRFLNFILHLPRFDLYCIFMHLIRLL